MSEFTAVIPVYNKRETVARAVNSVLNQTFTDFELIVVDDGSTDGSLEVLRSLNGDSRLRIISQPNCGKAVARNVGVEMARSATVAFLDGDDEWLPGFLAQILELRRRFPSASVFAGAYVIDKGEGLLWYPQGRRPAGPPRILRNVQDLYPKLSCSSTAVTVDAFRTAGGFRAGMRRAEDVDLWLRLAARFPIAYSPVPTAIWHLAGAAHDSKRNEPRLDLGLVDSALEIHADPMVSREAARGVTSVVKRMLLSELFRIRAYGAPTLLAWIGHRLFTQTGRDVTWYVGVVVACLPTTMCRMALRAKRTVALTLAAGLRWRRTLVSSSR